MLLRKLQHVGDSCGVVQLLQKDPVAAGLTCIQLFQNSATADEAVKHLEAARVMAPVPLPEPRCSLGAAMQSRAFAFRRWLLLLRSRLHVPPLSALASTMMIRIAESLTKDKSTTANLTARCVQDHFDDGLALRQAAAVDGGIPGRRAKEGRKRASAKLSEEEIIKFSTRTALQVSAAAERKEWCQCHVCVNRPVFSSFVGAASRLICTLPTGMYRGGRTDACTSPMFT